jgi:hypothetical protein
MRRWLAVVGVVAAFATSGAADGKKPGKGFWKILVKPGAKWVLREGAGTSDADAKTLTIETYDVRTIGKAQVARVRYTLGDDAEALKYTHAGPITQFAVTDAGLYMLWASMDDAKVAEALKKPPSRSDPPKPYKATKLNEGRSLEITKDGLVCMIDNPLPDDPCLEQGCEGGAICISATEGIVGLEGTWAPGGTEFFSVKLKKK